jgi:hypothetical protein
MIKEEKKVDHNQVLEDYIRTQKERIEKMKQKSKK